MQLLNFLYMKEHFNADNKPFQPETLQDSEIVSQIWLQRNSWSNIKHHQNTVWQELRVTPDKAYQFSGVTIKHQQMGESFCTRWT